jgi:hypothetical protein
MRYLNFLALSLLAFMLGFAMYVVTLAVVWRQTLGSGGVRAVMVWGALAYLLIALPLYVSSFRLVHWVWSQWARAPHPWVLFPLTALPISILSVGAMLVWLGGGERSSSGFMRVLMLPEAQLLYVFFGTTGVVMGVSWWALFARPRTVG